MSVQKAGKLMGPADFVRWAMKVRQGLDPTSRIKLDRRVDKLHTDGKIDKSLYGEYLSASRLRRKA